MVRVPPEVHRHLTVEATEFWLKILYIIKAENAVNRNDKNNIYDNY